MQANLPVQYAVAPETSYVWVDLLQKVELRAKQLHTCSQSCISICAVGTNKVKYH